VTEAAASSSDSHSSPAATGSRGQLLSRREQDVVRLLLRGDRVPAIAQHLWLTQSTIRNYLYSVYRKLGVKSQQELIVLLRDTPRPGQRGGDVGHEPHAREKPSSIVSGAVGSNANVSPSEPCQCSTAWHSGHAPSRASPATDTPSSDPDARARPPRCPSPGSPRI
jgi:DNA-binding CsgD family transcriptional regulator